MANSQVKQARPWETLESILNMWLRVVIECGLVILRNAFTSQFWWFVGGEEVSNCLRDAKCFGIGEILSGRAQNRKGGVTLGCGVIFTDQGGI
jgi:hypothetical protein